MARYGQAFKDKAVARFEALLMTAALDEAGKSAWCRERGVYPQELEQWLESATQALVSRGETRASPRETKADRRRLKEPKRELRRKDKALTKTTALLVLSKTRGDLPTGQGRMIGLEDRQTWGHDFVRWYNFDHRHSGIRYVTPAQRHAGEDHAILAARHQMYLQTREGNAARRSGNTRDWSPIGAVTLNPERDDVIRNLLAENKTRLAA